MPKRAAQSGETCRAAKRARNKEDSPLRKIRSPQLQAPTKNSDSKKLSDIFMSACPNACGAVYFWAWYVEGADKEQFACFAPANNADGKTPSVFLSACPHPACAVIFLAWFYAVTSIIAIEKRFRNIAEGNISRLRDAQAFHAAVKRPPYFMFARSADILPPGTACPACPRPACAVYFGLSSMRGR